ncbi:BlaI/MecI/CopY family transcriptional regulator [Anthocerotibacter panamensis]|uniref:BlaI/MecI/CopY family transcriptional regulator n=1 Tax=Anthocerotibacter panamensis TaxID=2857077 RepID=UPI001FDA582F|nr:BlaI/MecI/CopY family transcriptional regulator [Anthocerotibacter panamensis]
MARKKSPTLTEAEVRLMEILWKRSCATVGEVVEALPNGSPLAYSTVLTTLRILEQKGYVRHTEKGRAFVYHPVLNRDEACRSTVRHMMGRFFNNSPELLVLHVLENEALDAQALKRLKQIIEQHEV